MAPILYEPLDLQKFRRRVVHLERGVLDVKTIVEESLEVETDQVAVVLGMHENMR